MLCFQVPGHPGALSVLGGRIGSAARPAGPAGRLRAEAGAAVTAVLELQARERDTRLRGARILLVDDEQVNIAILTRVLEGAGYQNVLSTQQSTQTAALFHDFQPDLICLDLHMPVLDGFAVLEQLQTLIPADVYLPILMLTGDSSAQAAQRGLSLGARDFITKPFAPFEVLLRIRNLLEPRFMHLQLRESNQLLEERVRQRTQALDLVRLEVLDRLTRAAEFRDDATGQHTRRVGTLSALLAEEIGATCTEVDCIARAAPLHDLGKIGVPDQILLKQGPLTPEEFEIMKRHATIGGEILSGGQSELVAMAEQIARSHHEHWDGSGYPGGLSGTAIPLPARIVAVADVFDALDRKSTR